MSGGPIPPAWRPRLALVASVAAALLVFLPVLDAFFFADDFCHLYDFIAKGYLQASLVTWGGHLIVVSQTIFWIMFRLFGMSTEPYFVLALTLHALNIVLLFRLLRRVTASVALAWLGATLWGTTPAQGGTLAWVSAQEQLFASTLLLVVLDDMTERWHEDRPISAPLVAAWGAMMLAACLCHGVALPVGIVFPGLCWLLAPPAGFTRAGWRTVVLVPLVVVVVNVVLRGIVAGWVHDTGPTLGTIVRSADPGQVVAIWTGLVTYGTSALVLGPLVDVGGWPNVLAVGAALAVLVTALDALRTAGPTSRRLLLAFGALSGAVYGVTALGRAALFTIAGFSIDAVATTPRYHYLGTALLVVVLMVALAQGLALRRAEAARRPVAAVWLALLAAAHVAAPAQIDLHDQARDDVIHALRQIRKDVLAAGVGSTAIVPNRGFSAATCPFPGVLGVFALYYPGDKVAGRTVRFRDTPEAAAALRALGGRVGALVVAAGEE